MKRAVRNFVNGEQVDATDGRTTDLVNPATGEAFGTAPLSGPADVDAAMNAAAAAFESWRDSTPAERQLALLKIADAIEARADELIAAESENTGKPIGLTPGEDLPPMVDQIRFFAGAARVLEGRSAGEYMAGHTSFVRREPIGVCAQVTPWNYPMMMAVWKFAPALAAGNTVVLKPADTTPVTTAMMAEIAAEFLPPGVFNVICGDRDTGRALVDHEVPRFVSITGSVRAGMEVAGAAAKDLKRVHLELGGKAPVVVFDDADIAAAAEAIATAATSTSPPSCPGCAKTTRRPSARSSAPSSRCSGSPMRTRRCAGPTGWTTAWPRRSGPAITGGRCGWPSASTSAASGSTPTARWSPRCRTAASSTRVTARTCRRARPRSPTAE